jgi:hypothetical protein
MNNNFGTRVRGNREDIQKKWTEKVQKWRGLMEKKMADMSTKANTMTNDFSKKIADDVVNALLNRISLKSDGDVPAITKLGGGGKKKSKKSKKSKRYKKKRTKRKKTKKSSRRR